MGGDTCPGISMGSLDFEANRLLKASLASSTWNSYSRTIDKFNEFRIHWNFDLSWPVITSTIVAFLAFLSLEGFAPATISSHLSAIAFVHNVNGWPDPTISFIVKKMKEGCRRLNAHSDSRRPITFPLLKRLIKVLPSICRSSYEVIMFKSSFLLAFFGFLRVGEFACVNKKCVKSRVIAVSDITFDGSNCSNMFVNIRFSKTDQCGNSNLLVIDRISEISMCPMQAILEFLKIRHPSIGPLFLHFDGTPLSTYQFNQVLKKCISAIGLNANDFSSHSFRIGAATSAAMCGISEEDIKRLGRLKSAAFKFYIRPNQLFLII